MEKQSLFGLLVIFFFQDSSSVCDDQGVFVNPDDKTCKSYNFCFRLPDGTFLVKSYLCQDGTLFDPSTKICSKSYACDSSITLPVNSTTAGTPTTFECTSQGTFPEENDGTCSGYFFCHLLPTGKYIMKKYTCPMGTKFDTKLKICTSKFKCSSSAIATTPSSVQSTESFSCVQQGRFPLQEDLTCRSYYYCLYLPGGGFTKQVFRCPKSLKFDPIKQTCSGDYQCSTPTTISSSLATTTSSTVSSTQQTTTIKDYFVCSSVGRFADSTDSTCKTYFYCVQLPSGVLEFQKFKCPKDEVFDSNLQICSSTFKCPTEKISAEYSTISVQQVQ